MKERRQGEGDTGTRGQPRALGPESCGRSGGRAADRAREAGRPRGARPPGPRRLRGLLLPLSLPGPSVGNSPTRISAGPPARYTWTPASPRGCPHSAQTKPIEAESWAARSSAGRPLKTRALPGLPPLARPGAPAGRSQRPGLRAAVARTRRWGRGRRAGRQVPVRAARRPHSRVRTDEQPGEKAARAGTRASAPWPGRWASARLLPDAGAAGEA